MSNPWFRLYSEFADDPKVQRMPEAMQRRLIMLMCLRCKDETFDETLQAFQWRITHEEMSETKKLFLTNGFIDEEWDLVNWNRRQYISDSSTERVRQYRERKKRRETLQKPPDDSDIDADETGGNVTVTAPDTDTEQIQTQSRAETEHKQPSAREAAKRDALALVEELETLTPGALGDLAKQIACRHPRSRMRMWTEANVGDADTKAILDAMANEAQLTGTTMAKAGRMMLELLDAWDDIPRDRWQYAAAIPRFYKQGDYRLQPNELPGIDPQEGKKAHGTRSSSRGTDGNAEALQGIVAAAIERERAESGGDSGLPGHAGAVAGPEDNPDDGEGLHGNAGGDEPGGDRVGVQPSARRVQFFPVPAILREYSGRPVSGDPIAAEAKEGLLSIIEAMRGKHGPKLRDILGKLKYGTEDAPRNAEGGLVPYCDAPREPATPFVMSRRVENALVRLGWGSREAGIAIIADHPAVSRRDVDPDADDKYRQNQLRAGDEITNRFVAAYREVQG